MITDDVSNTKTREEMNSGKNIPLQAAIAANAPPSAKDPVSPMNTEALNLLCKRKPTHAPDIDAPNIERSGLKLQYKSVFQYHKLRNSHNAE